MSITYKYNSTVIDRLACRQSIPCISNRGIYHLFFTFDSVFISIYIFLSATHVWHIRSSTHTLVINHIGIGIREIGCQGPIRLYGDARHTFRHIPIGALVEHTATDTILVLIGTVAVCKVVGSGSDFAFCVGRGIFTGGIGTLGTARETCNLPTCHHAVAGIVACTYIIIIR